MLLFCDFPPQSAARTAACFQEGGADPGLHGDPRLSEWLDQFEGAVQRCETAVESTVLFGFLLQEALGDGDLDMLRSKTSDMDELAGTGTTFSSMLNWSPQHQLRLARSRGPMPRVAPYRREGGKHRHWERLESDFQNLDMRRMWHEGNAIVALKGRATVTTSAGELSAF